MTPRIILLLTALFVSNVTTAEELNVQLANESARFMYLTEAFGQDFGRLELEVGFLYNENNDSLVNVGLLVRGESVSVPIIISVGARAYIAEIGSFNVAAVAVGGDVLLSPESWNGFGLGVFYFTAPGIVSYNDAKGLSEYGAYINFQVTPQARMVLGYQRIDVELDNNTDVTIEKGTYFGLNLSF